MSGKTRTVDILDHALAGLWNKGLSPPPVFEADRLIAEAKQRAAFSDFNDPELPHRLVRLCRALDTEAGLTPLGRTLSYGGLRRVLTMRLQCEAALAAHPQALARPVAAPIVIVGPMRSGTTRVQRLLATDTRFVHTRLFEAMVPSPGPRWRRTLETRALGTAMDVFNPEVRRIHPGDSVDAEEELPILELALSGAQIEAQRPIPSWARWMEQTPQTHAYRWLKRWLQLTGHMRGDDPAKPWLLKTPQYAQDLPELLSVFPDARLIFTHRRPRDVVGSAASLAWNYMKFQSKTATPAWCGREWLHKTEHRLRVSLEVRNAAAHIDLRFDELSRDWCGEMARVYDWLGLDFDEQTAERMKRYLNRASRRHLKRPHHYDLEAFGVSGEEIDERFSAYITEFALS
ncbi:MAG: sulfotransferase [Pacificimonas sp.]